MSVLKPWTPVKTKKTENGYEISVLGRKYTLDGQSPMFSSVISDGEELLASPMRIVAKNNGVECVFGKVLTYSMNDADDESCTVISTFQSDNVVVNVSHTVEFDGFDDIALSVMPTGRSVAACFGLEKYDATSFDLDTLYLEVPLRKDVVKYYNIHPGHGVVYNNPDDFKYENVKSGNFLGNGEIPTGGVHSSFATQIYLNGNDKGLGFSFGSNENFANTDEKNVVEVLDNKSEYLLRIHILDKAPDFWLDKGENNARSHDLIPIQYKFGMQVTPVKPFEKRLFKEKNLHIDCFKKIFVDYDEFLSNPVVDGDSEIGFDRIKRLGVDTLYIHEKWNDIQNSPEITFETSKRLKYIIDECHKRGIRVIPYFGYETSTLSPFYKKYGGKHCVRPEKITCKSNSYWQWYRYPYQRDEKACVGSADYTEYFYNGLTRLQKEYGFDGFYFDGTVFPACCANISHGCGWTDKDGNVHATYNFSGARELIKKIYAYSVENNLSINIHTTGVYTLPCIGFCSSVWEGEMVQSAFLNGYVKHLPEGMMKAMFSGRDLGVPMYTLCYSKDDVWSFESAASIALLYGSLPKPVDIGKPLEYMSKIWKIMDEFPIEKSSWRPYYENADKISSNNENVKISYYETADKLLAFCTSVYSDFDENVEISSDFSLISDAVTGENISANGKCRLHFKGFECKILVLTK